MLYLPNINLLGFLSKENPLLFNLQPISLHLFIKYQFLSLCFLGFEIHLCNAAPSLLNTMIIFCSSAAEPLKPHHLPSKTQTFYPVCHDKTFFYNFKYFMFNAAQLFQEAYKLQLINIVQF